MGPFVTGVDPITIRRSFDTELVTAALQPGEVEQKRQKIDECIDSATGQETQLAVLGTTQGVLYTVQSIQNVLHYDALQKELESYGSVRKLREAGGMHRPELDGNEQNATEHTGNYLYRTGPGSVNPYSYPCRHVRASDLWCRDGTMSPFKLIDGTCDKK